MNLYLVSDNNFFLLGLQKNNRYQREDVSFIHSRYVTHGFQPQSGDVLLLYINDVGERQRILALPALAGHRMILLLKMDVPCGYVCSGPFPWLMPEDTAPEKLYLHLLRAAYSVFNQQLISEREALIFRCLSEGYPMIKIESIAGVSEKDIHLLRRRVKMRYGLWGHDAATTLLCRDINCLSQINGDMAAGPHIHSDCYPW